MDLVCILQVMSLVILSPYSSPYKGKEIWAKYFTQSDLSNHSQVCPSAVRPVIKLVCMSHKAEQRCSSGQKKYGQLVEIQGCILTCSRPVQRFIHVTIRILIKFQLIAKNGVINTSANRYLMNFTSASCVN